MTDLSPLLKRVDAAGFVLVLTESGFTARPKPEARSCHLPSAVVAELKQYRDEVIAWLSRPPEVGWERCTACGAGCVPDLWRDSGVLCPMPTRCPFRNGSR